MNDASEGNVPSRLCQMFEWWNEIIGDNSRIVRSEFSKFFTDDAVMVINREVRASGIDEIIERFLSVHHSVDYVEICLPVEKEFSSANNIFTSHLVKSRVGNDFNEEHVVGYAETKDDKIAIINFLSLPIAKSEP